MHGFVNGNFTLSGFARWLRFSGGQVARDHSVPAVQRR